MDQPKYHIDIFWSHEDGGYIANVPDLRYCSAFGESYEEALREVLVSMELHLDTLRELGRPIPEPGAHRGVGVSALVLESGQTIEFQRVEGSGSLGVGFVSDEGVAGYTGAIVEITQGAGQAVEDISETAESAVEDVGEGAGSAVADVGEGAGSAVEDIGEGSGHQVRDYSLEYDENEEVRSARRRDRSGNQ